MTDFINGYPIRASFETPKRFATRAGRFILVERDTDHEPWVTAWLGDGDTGWISGHYFSARWKAEKDFLERCSTEIRHLEALAASEANKEMASV